MGCKSFFSLKVQFPDVEDNPSPRAVPQCFRIVFSNINGLHVNRDELTIATTKFDVVTSAETDVTLIPMVWLLLVSPLLLTVLSWLMDPFIVLVCVGSCSDKCTRSI